MTDARSIPAAVQWHEGMLLSPQHFQQNGLRAQALQSYLMLAAAPYHWGIKQLEIDPNALQVGTFALTGLEATMPDGLLVAYPAMRIAWPLGQSSMSSHRWIRTERARARTRAPARRSDPDASLCT